MKAAAPPCRTLTSARLDRDADLDRDYAAVATALHADAGVPADQAITELSNRSGPARPCGRGGIGPSPHRPARLLQAQSTLLTAGGRAIFDLGDQSMGRQQPPRGQRHVREPACAPTSSPMAP
jgi:hypothetical protein